MPNSSASIITLRVHLVMFAQFSSLPLTTGPNGSLEIVSGKIIWSAGFLVLVLFAANPDLSVV